MTCTGGRNTMVCTCAGNSHGPAVMGWRNLPPDMEEQILFKLSLLELARVSTTCRRFGDVFCRKMVEEEKARRRLTLLNFGQERIKSIVARVGGYLKGNIMKPSMVKGVTGKCWITANGAWHVRGSSGVEDEEHVGDTPVSVSVSDEVGCVSMTVIAPNQSKVVLSIFPLRKLIMFRLWPLDDDDLEGIALVQSLITEAVAQGIHDGGVSFDISIAAWVVIGRCRCTSAGLQAQIKPLLACASQCKCEKVTVVSEVLRGQCLSAQLEMA
jgi:hypothetical protein